MSGLQICGEVLLRGDKEKSFMWQAWSERGCRQVEDTWGTYGVSHHDHFCSPYWCAQSWLQTWHSQRQAEGSWKTLGHLFQLSLTFFQWHYLCSIQHNPASTMRMLFSLFHLLRGNSEKPYKQLLDVNWKKNLKQWIPKILEAWLSGTTHGVKLEKEKWEGRVTCQRMREGDRDAPSGIKKQG